MSNEFILFMRLNDLNYQQEDLIMNTNGHKDITEIHIKYRYWKRNTNESNLRKNKITLRFKI